MIYLTLFISSLLFSYLIGEPVINFLKSLGAKQAIRQEGPQEHLTTKTNTPTIGGIIFLIPFFIIFSLYFLFFKKSNSFDLVVFLISLTSMLIIGLIDDLLKVLKKNNRGISGWIKLLVQLIISMFLFLIYKEGMSLIYLIWIFFIFAGASNSYNLTDGLDGLVTLVMVGSLFGIIVISFYLGNYDLSAVLVILLGSLYGFFYFNKFPAKVFMGDTGSLALGAVIGVSAIILKIEFYLMFFAFIPIIESLSVIIQVVVFKFFKKFFKIEKRIFKMTPIHHHYELSGLSEVQIVQNFFYIQAFFSILGIFVFIFLN